MAQSRRVASRRAFVSIGALAATTLSLLGTAKATPLTIGPVEQVNLRSSTVVVLGQTYHIGPSISVLSKVTGARVGLGSIAPGTLVSIDGTESANGTATVQSVASLAQLYVPGATQLLITGVVTAVAPTGQIRVGKLSIDVNATLTDDSQHVVVGQLVQAVGTQPNPGGLFVAQSAVDIAGIGGSGVSAAGIGGSGAMAGIGGSGTAVAGIGGSGASVAGIGGSGAMAGIGGSGASAKGIGGSGTAAAGIGGSGASVAGIGGSGAMAGIGGSGASAKGIGGSGTAAAGIGGSGASVAGIGGSGAMAGIGGSGASAKGIGGSGTAAAGIGGSGASVKGIGGSGAAAAGIGGSGS